MTRLHVASHPHQRRRPTDADRCEPTAPDAQTRIGNVGKAAAAAQWTMDHLAQVNAAGRPYAMPDDRSVRPILF